MKKASLLTAIVFSASIMTTFAQGQVNGSQPLQILALAQTVVNRLSPILVTVALLAFFWFLIKFISNSDNPGEQAKLKKGIFYSILALFVLVSIWGIIGNIQTILGVDPTRGQPHVETLPPGWKN